MESVYAWAVRLAGLGIVIREAFHGLLDRPFLLGTAAAMMGLADKVEQILKGRK